MTTNPSVRLAALLLLCGCNRDPENLASDQAEARRTLTEEQATERREQTQAQTRAAADQLHEAREDLPGRVDDVREETADLAAANRALAETISVACSGVATPDACPIDETTVVSSNESEHGLVLHLSPAAGTSTEVRRRIDCYRARTTLRAPPADEKCILDLTNLDVGFESREVDGHAVVTFTSPDETRLDRLRTRVRSLLSEVAARRTGTPRN